MNITPESPVRFPTTIQGVACVILVTHYLPAEPSITSGPMEDAEEGVPIEIEYSILESRNPAYTLTELQGMTSDDDDAHIIDEFEAYLLALKHDKDF
ncbi:MAG TPA: hypothetical protein VM783_17595 [Candidatus Acidoferrum sp.]|nr:hypothetical protein [Candidatus Acidoferrum sp.]